MLNQYFSRVTPLLALQMERKERKSPASDTLYEVVSLESETEREKRKTTASPGTLTSGAGTMVPSPPEDDEEEGDWMHCTLVFFCFFDSYWPVDE